MLSPPGPEPHRRTPGQPDRRTASLESRRRTRYRLFRTLLTASPSVHLKISGHFEDHSAQKPTPPNGQQGKTRKTTRLRLKRDLVVTATDARSSTLGSSIPITDE